MKKSLLLSLILLSGVLLAACDNKSDENVVENWEPTESVVETQDKNATNDASENKIEEENIVENQESVENTAKNKESNDTVDVEECKNAVQKYLDEADKEWNWKEVKAWDNITVDYIWRLEDGTVFDTSVESVAKACGKYITWRNYTEWLPFEVWALQMIKWFDEWVVWMKIWQTKTVQFWPEDWYGEYDEESVITVSVDQFWDISQLNEWDTVDLWLGMPVKIKKITDEEIIFDFNHELAWKSLIFDITLKSIN